MITYNISRNLVYYILNCYNNMLYVPIWNYKICVDNNSYVYLYTYIIFDYLIFFKGTYINSCLDI